jgi:predicted RNA binding protein YcfA (HicA-like mRNA interferase family)
MSNPKKTLFKLLGGQGDANIPFNDLVGLLLRLGFDLRIRGSHHIFSKPHVDEIINLQPHGAKAKPYQVRQVRELLTRYSFTEL